MPHHSGLFSGVCDAAVPLLWYDVNKLLRNVIRIDYEKS